MKKIFCRSKKLGKKAMLIATLIITATVVTAGIISYLMVSDVEVTITGKDMYITVNGHSIPYDESLTISMDAGNYTNLSYEINNTGSSGVTVYPGVSGFNNLSVEMSPSSGFNVGSGTTMFYVNISSDPWLMSEVISGNIYLNTTG